MERWEYQITIHSRDEILDRVEGLGSGSGGREAPVIFCDAQGTCFFDYDDTDGHAPNPYVRAITNILNRKGEDGWRLVQVTFREEQLICVWQRPC